MYGSGGPADIGEVMKTLEDPSTNGAVVVKYASIEMIRSSTILGPMFLGTTNVNWYTPMYPLWAPSSMADMVLPGIMDDLA